MLIHGDLENKFTCVTNQILIKFSHISFWGTTSSPLVRNVRNYMIKVSGEVFCWKLGLSNSSRVLWSHALVWKNVCRKRELENSDKIQNSTVVLSSICKVDIYTKWSAYPGYSIYFPIFIILLSVLVILVTHVCSLYL